MSNLRPASSIIPHAPGLAQPLAKPTGISPGIAHAPGLQRPADHKPPPVHHAPGLSADHRSASQQAIQAVVALHAPVIDAHVPIAEQPVRVPPHGSIHGRVVPTSDFDKIKRRRVEGVPEIGLAAPRQPQQGEAPPVQQMRQLTNLPPNNRSNAWVFDPTQYKDPNSSPHTVAFVQPIFQFNGNVDDTDMLTIMLGLEYLNAIPNSNGDDFHFQAIVTWGVGNATFSATIDWKQGTAITLPANFLSLSVSIPVTRWDRTPQVKFNAGVAYGAIPAQDSRATFTAAGVLVTKNGGTAVVNIPDWAVSFGAAQGTFDASYAGPFLMQPFGGGAAEVSIEPSIKGTDYRADAFSIPNGSRQILITNNDTNTDVNVVVIFGFPF